MISVSSRALAVALFGLLFCSCDESITAIPDRYLGVNATLQAIQNRAPLVAKFAMDPERRECRVDHWGDLHPDQPERAWASLTRTEVVEVDNAHPSIADYADARFVFGDFSQVQDSSSGSSIYLVAPWAGSAEIVCGGEPVTGALVVVRYLIAQGTTDHGTSDDEALEIASENVEREGLDPIVDLDLTVQNGCINEPPELNCHPGEPRPLSEQ